MGIPGHPANDRLKDVLMDSIEHFYVGDYNVEFYFDGQEIDVSSATPNSLGMDVNEDNEIELIVRVCLRTKLMYPCTQLLSNPIVLMNT